MSTDGYIDLHCHTVFSDGSFEPEEVVEMAYAAGVSVLAITDHDDVACYPRAKAVTDARGMRLLSGTELSAQHRGADVHILGYGFDPFDGELQERLAEYRETRMTRAERMVEKLQAVGVDVDFADIPKPADGGAIGRPHLAQHLVATGHVRDVQDAFDRYLASGKPAYVDKQYLTPKQACDVIRDAGGVPVIAHPKLCGAKNWLDELVEAGLGGVEVLHSSHSAADIRDYAALADHFGLVKTGGCDFHGAAKPDVEFGSVRTPLEWLGPLDDAIAAARVSAGRAT